MPIAELDLNLLQELKKVSIRAKRKVLSRILEGSWAALLKGRGMEFAGFRQYVYGDDASKIDWNASLRAKDTLVREFEEYKTVNVFFLLDVNDSMFFTSQEKLKVEYAAELTFNLAAAIIDAGDSVGYAMFTEELIKHQYPTMGRDVVYRLAQDLSNGKNYGGKRDFKRAMLLSKESLPHPCLLIMVSDFLELPDGWERYIKMFAVEYDLIGIMLRDPHDSELPMEGIQSVVGDPLNPHDKMLIDVKKYAAAFKEETAKEEAYIQSVFEKARGGFVKLHTTDDYFDILAKYFHKRMKLIQS